MQLVDVLGQNGTQFGTKSRNKFNQWKGSNNDVSGGIPGAGQIKQLLANISQTTRSDTE